jgi:hypothetical protein
MTDGRWNPTPPGGKRMPAAVPRVRGEEVWRVSREGRVATCELRDDSRIFDLYDIPSEEDLAEAATVRDREVPDRLSRVPLQTVANG